MNAVELCKKYQDALSNKDLPAIRSLFTPDAVVSAPVSGKANIEQFHTYLFTSTKKTVANFPNVLGARQNPPSITMQFSYTLSVSTGDVAVIDGIVVFGIDESLGKFKSLDVIYDPSEIRRFMQDAGIEPPATGSAATQQAGQQLR